MKVCSIVLLFGGKEAVFVVVVGGGYLSVFVWMVGPDSHVDVSQVDNILRKLQEELLTQIVRVDHIRRNEHYWAGDHPRDLAFRRTTYAQVGTFVQGDTLQYTIVHTVVTFG